MAALQPTHQECDRPGGGRTHTTIRSVLAALALAMAGLAGVTPSPASGLDDPNVPASLDQILSSTDYKPEHADVLRLYLAFFDRQPDFVGANYWIDQYDAGANLDDLAWGFSSSTEFLNSYGGDLTDREFLAIVYGNVLGRTPDAGGLDYWEGELVGGLSRHGAVRWIAANDEFKVAYPFDPGASPAGASGWASGTTVEWFDHLWKIEPLVATPDPESTTAQDVTLRIRVRNPLTDISYTLPTSWVGLRDAEGDRYSALKVRDVLSGRNAFDVRVGSEASKEYEWQFSIPVGVSVNDLSVEIGAAPNRPAVVSRNGTVGGAYRNDVALGTTSWDGEYSWNSATLTVTGAFASGSAGIYADGTERPSLGFSGDRQANDDETFVHVDFDITEYSSSGVAGININEFRIDADGAKFGCADDAPGLLVGRTASFSITCPVPESATTLVLEIGTDPCVGGCKEWAWTSSVEL